MLIKRFLVDLCTTATSHIVVAEWMPRMPPQAAYVLAVLLSIFALGWVRTAKPMHVRKVRQQRKLEFSVGPEGIKFSLYRVGARVRTQCLTSSAEIKGKTEDTSESR
jgi:hypothetical protein